MKLLALVFILLFSLSRSFAADFRPSDIQISRGEIQKAVFVNFLSAHYRIIYNAEGRQAWVESYIQFEQFSDGAPIFDLVEDPDLVTINGSVVPHFVQETPESETNVRVAAINLETGKHELLVRSKLNKLVKWAETRKSVRSAFWMTDLKDRNYLEQFLATNLEYDQYQMSMEVKVEGTNVGHQLYVNGTLREREKNRWLVEFPSYFNSTSVFFHLVESEAYPEKRFGLQSIDGRSIPVILYGREELHLFEKKIPLIFSELEADFGAWPHSSLIVYTTESGGMEYAGATATSIKSLGHEMVHSYFGRGVFSSRGNSGWIDEAIASWRDRSYQVYTEDQLHPSGMGGASEYSRVTSSDAYTKGPLFLGFLHGKFSGQGGLKPFLKQCFTDNKFRPMSNQIFQSLMEEFFAVELGKEFATYVYYIGFDFSVEDDRSHSVHHPLLSEKELYELL